MLEFMGAKVNTTKKVTNRLSWDSILDKTKLSLAGTFNVITRWQYLLITLAAVVVFGTVLSILSIGSFELHLLTSSIAISAKADIIFSAFIRFLTDYSFIGILTLATAILQGVVISLITFNLLEQRKLDQNRNSVKKEVTGSTIASVIAGLSAGCATCGASLLIPIISLLSSSVAFINSALIAIPILAIVLLAYSIWSLGHTSFMYSGFKS